MIPSLCTFWRSSDLDHFFFIQALQSSKAQSILVAGVVLIKNNYNNANPIITGALILSGPIFLYNERGLLGPLSKMSYVKGVPLKTFRVIFCFRFFSDHAALKLENCFVNPTQFPGYYVLMLFELRNFFFDCKGNYGTPYICTYMKLEKCLTFSSQLTKDSSNNIYCKSNRRSDNDKNINLW